VALAITPLPCSVCSGFRRSSLCRFHGPYLEFQYFALVPNGPSSEIKFGSCGGQFRISDVWRLVIATRGTFPCREGASPQSTRLVQPSCHCRWSFFPLEVILPTVPQSLHLVVPRHAHCRSSSRCFINDALEHSTECSYSRVVVGLIVVLTYAVLQ
jgi:hypothetical protein